MTGASAKIGILFLCLTIAICCLASTSDSPRPSSSCIAIPVCHFLNPIMATEIVTKPTNKTTIMIPTILDGSDAAATLIEKACESELPD